MINPLPIPLDTVPSFCRKWKVRQLGVIGSVLRSDFRADSDVDVVVTFEPDSTWDMFDIVRMREELGGMFGRPVDLIEESAVRNPYMLESIRRTQRELYAA